ncbi:DUF4339 domain-containing protein [Bradyrhizobium sp. S3.9.1]|uniref:DUF4339 domain-containing protein n=1 Tax=Bradyrhizobium sp. S3.9.1 TaxID=3156431 RepID=UPI0033966A2D
MSIGWFYDDGGQARGPITSGDLFSCLKQRDDWGTVLVWREGFADWKQAAEVEELLSRLTRPPPLPRPRTSMTSVPKAGPQTLISEPRGSAVEAPGSVRPVEPQKKKGSWVLKTLGWIGLFAAAALAKGIGSEFGKTVSGPSRAEQIEAGLSKIETQLRAELPKKLDDYTTLIAVDHAGYKLRTTSVVDPGKGNVIPTTFLQTVRAQALPKVCAEKETNGLNAGIIFEYAFRDAQAKYLGAYTIAKADCNSAS